MASSSVSDVYIKAWSYIHQLSTKLSSSVQSLLEQSINSLRSKTTYLPHSLLDYASKLVDNPSPQLILPLVLPILILLFSMSSGWRSYFNGNGRYSPFSGPATRSPPTVTDDDFSYLVGDEEILDNSSRPQCSHRPPESYFSGAPAPSAYPAEHDSAPDILVLKHRERTYPLHFPAYAIGEGLLKIGELRRMAAEKTESGDPRRVKLLYKGKILKDDHITCREEGLKQHSELMCVISEGVMNGRPGDDESSESVAEEDEGPGQGVRIDVDGTIIGGGGGRRKKRKNHRSGTSKKKLESNRDGIYSTSSAPHNSSHHLNTDTWASSYTSPSVPSSTAPTPRPKSPLPPQQQQHQPAPPSSSSTAQRPKTALSKIEDIASNLHTQFVPRCVSFTSNPPSDPKARDFEYKKLSESILAQVLLKLDEVETEGDESARASRKALVRETQALLAGLDAVGKR